jgi:hypothetical protein
LSLDPQRFASITAASLRREHGCRARYVAGCRCLKCRAANSRYASERYEARQSGDCRECVPAEPARLHILKLSREGIGYKAVGEAAGAAGSIVAKIRLGERTEIRKSTEARILAVDADAIADGQIVSGDRTHALIRKLTADGYTRVWIAKQLGYKGRGLQFRERVTARTASRVERLYARILAGRVSR